MTDLLTYLTKTNRLFYKRIDLENKFGKEAVLQLIENKTLLIKNGLNCESLLYNI